jgi:hypothetical protein
MHATKKYYVSMSSLPIKENYIRFEVFMAVTGRMPSSEMICHVALVT